jgi:hypothetical protein
MIYSIFVGYILTNRRSIPQFNIRCHGLNHTWSESHGLNHTMSESHWSEAHWCNALAQYQHSGDCHLRAIEVYVDRLELNTLGISNIN